jgi:hypothetical protein
VSDENIQKLVAYCEDKLNLTDIQLGDEYGYPNLPLCIIDAIFSINANYTSTENTVKRFVAYFDASDSLTVRELVDLYAQHSVEFMAEEVYKNRQRTSTKNGILKAEAVLEVAKVLLKYGVNTLEDMQKVTSHAAFRADYRAIRGQSSGVSLRYFYMLAGVEAEIKPDRMIVRFIEAALGRKVNVKECHKLLVAAAEELRAKYPDVTPRSLDHIIWRYQRK